MSSSSSGAPVRAAVLTGIGEPLDILELDYREPAADELVVRTLAAPFCSTDWLGWRGMRNKRPPVVLGHTAVGEVVRIGTAVDDLSLGQRVLVASTPECGRCFYCGIGRPDQCDALFATAEPTVGHWDGRPVVAAGHVGAYAARMIVRRHSVWALPDDLDPVQLSLLGCGILTGHGAIVNVAEVQPGQSVAVVGLGHIGLWTVQAARAVGAGMIIGVDPVADRRQAALRLGATDVVDPAAGDPVAMVRTLAAGRGVDVAVETAGPVAAVTQSVAMSRRAGTVVLTGVSDFGADVAIPQLSVSVHGRRILACQNGQPIMRRDLPRCLEALRTGIYQALPLITATYRLDEINDALLASGSLRDLSGVLVDFD